jgi:hypothetical protein
MQRDPEKKRAIDAILVDPFEKTPMVLVDMTCFRLLDKYGS